uniref:Uncharacterized protein n=1 Tax=Oryza glaberrima TaxID=4538 RepID=I1QBW3_ORYGL
MAGIVVGRACWRWEVVRMSSSPWDHADECLHLHFILPRVLTWRRCRSRSPRLDAAAAVFLFRSWKR